MGEPEGMLPAKITQQNKFLHFISTHPFGVCVAFIASLATIGGIPLSIYLYNAVPRRELTYCIYPVRTSIVQSTNISDVTVSYKGHQINGNVSAAQVAIWNAGREPIRPDDILSPIILSIPDSEILDFKSMKVSR